MYEQIYNLTSIFFKSLKGNLMYEFLISKFTDKETEIENIIQAVVQGISVDDKRLFTIDDKKELLRNSVVNDNKYQCAICKKWFYSEELEVDHIEPWSKGGRTVLSNAQLLCKPCNKKKGNLF